MNLLPEIEQISAFKNNQALVLEKVKSGPVLLMQRSKPAVVMVSPDEWNATAKRLHDLEVQLARQRRLTLSNRRYLEMQNNPSMAVSEEEYRQAMRDAGLE